MAGLTSPQQWGNAPLPIPALHASHGGIWLRDRDGSQRPIGKGEAIMLLSETPVLILNAPLVASRLGYPELSGLDLLELFAFIHPARFMVPTPKGLADVLGLPQPGSDSDVPGLIHTAAEHLLAVMLDDGWHEREGAWMASQSLSHAGWAWGQIVAHRLPRPDQAERWLFSRLPEWEEAPEPTAPMQTMLKPADINERLDVLTKGRADERPGQRAYAEAAAQIFAPRKAKGSPNLLLSEAGTGIGKTFGYLAPASLWAQQSGGTVWISTFTRALQRQLAHESEALWPDPDQRREKRVIRKGRENYLCLLNLEDALQGGFTGRAAIMAQLVARWAGYSRDGDLIGGDLPGWLGPLFRQRGIAALTDRRGECIYAGCPHFRKCFIERSARASAKAEVVIANHALLMANAVRTNDAAARPTRVLFDEGHHLFDAADSMFAAAVSGAETIELRRWLIGPEGKSRGRRRGLAARLADVASYDEEGGEAIIAARDAALALPAEGWLARIGEASPFGAIEALLWQIRLAVLARDESGGQDAGYGLEIETVDLPGELIEASGEAARALEAIRQPLSRLRARLDAVLSDAPDWMDQAARARIEGATFALDRRIDLLTAWIAMLARLGGPADAEFVDWLALDRAEGREYDVGLHRRFLDPMKPFAEVVLKPAHGVLVTSATLRDGEDWQRAIDRTGAAYLDHPAALFAAPSPFDYARNAEVLIVTDVKKGDLAGLANAYAQLILAAGGGVLGLFTAIRRLRATYGRIADRLAREGLPLYAQHVDPIDTGTLVDIFRDDPAASLLGTDALRDGVDVPGHSLRLVVMEGVPWPKPSILHRARRLHLGSRHDDQLIRARLAQAFGRLIRRHDDSGKFVLLSAAMPSRLLTAFPPGTPIRRVTLADALQSVASGVSDRPDAADESQPAALLKNPEIS